MGLTALFNDCYWSFDIDLGEDLKPAVKRHIFNINTPYYPDERKYRSNNHSKAFRPKQFKRLTYTGSNRRDKREVKEL